MEWMAVVSLMVLFMLGAILTTQIARMPAGRRLILGRRLSWIAASSLMVMLPAIAFFLAICGDLSLGVRIVLSIIATTMTVLAIFDGVPESRLLQHFGGADAALFSYAEEMLTENELYGAGAQFGCLLEVQLRRWLFAIAPGGPKKRLCDVIDELRTHNAIDESTRALFHASRTVRNDCVHGRPGVTKQQVERLRMSVIQAARR